MVRGREGAAEREGKAAAVAVCCWVTPLWDSCAVWGGVGQGRRSAGEGRVAEGGHTGRGGGGPGGGRGLAEKHMWAGDRCRSLAVAAGWVKAHQSEGEGSSPHPTWPVYSLSMQCIKCGCRTCSTAFTVPHSDPHQALLTPIPMHSASREAASVASVAVLHSLSLTPTHTCPYCPLP